jgi:hypothetical protein
MRRLDIYLTRLTQILAKIERRHWVTSRHITLEFLSGCYPM